MTEIFDTHTHMNDSCFEEERKEILLDFPKRGIAAFTEIGYDLPSSQKAVSLAERLRSEENKGDGYPEIYAAIGFHPDHVVNMTEEALQEISKLAKSERVVAIGEIGLDYYYIDKRSESDKEEALEAKRKIQEIHRMILEESGNKLEEEGRGIGEELHRMGITQKQYKKWKRQAETVDFDYDPLPEVQMAAFVRQMELAKELGLPIVIHSRDAAKDTYDLVLKHRGYENGGIVHCFSYSPEVAEQYVRLGMYIGVGGVLTFPNGRKLKEVVERIPLSSMVLETDSPYMAPVPFRGSRNDSRNLSYVIAEMAVIKGVSEEEIIQTTTENARKVYRISKS